MKILVVNLADIGDLVLTTPALGALREALPDAQIHMLTSHHAAPVLDDGLLVNHVVAFDKRVFDSFKVLLKSAGLRRAFRLLRALRRERYDALLFFHKLTTRAGAWKYAVIGFATGAARRVGADNGRGWFLTERVPDPGFNDEHQAVAWQRVVARFIGQDLPKQPLHMSISAEDRAWAAQRLLAGPHYNAIHPGSGSFMLARRWPPERWAALADALATGGAQIVFVGGPADDTPAVQAAMHAAALDFTGQTTLGQLAALLERCEAYYGTDSGVMHIAAAVGARVTAIFGPTNAHTYGPYAETARVVSLPLRCLPCAYVDQTVGARLGCAQRTCLRTLTVKDLLSEFPIKSRQPATEQTVQIPPLQKILGIPIHPMTYTFLRAIIDNWIEMRIPRQLCTVNPEFLMTAQHDSIFYQILKRADLCMPDGVGLLWAARRLGQPLPERVTGSDGMPRIAEWAAACGWKLFLLGAAPGIAAQAATILQARYPGLQIAGTYAGNPGADQEDDIVARVNRSGADILFVAYGAPAQDKWIARNLHRLDTIINMGVGGAFDFISGTAPRAPLWMQRAGLEWLYRLIRQPWRWRRMLRLPLFVFAVLLRKRNGPVRFEGPTKSVRDG